MINPHALGTLVEEEKDEDVFLFDELSQANLEAPFTTVLGAADVILNLDNALNELAMRINRLASITTDISEMMNWFVKWQEKFRIIEPMTDSWIEPMVEGFRSHVSQSMSEHESIVGT